MSDAYYIAISMLGIVTVICLTTIINNLINRRK